MDIRVLIHIGAVSRLAVADDQDTSLWSGQPVELFDQPPWETSMAFRIASSPSRRKIAMPSILHMHAHGLDSVLQHGLQSGGLVDAVRHGADDALVAMLLGQAREVRLDERVRVLPVGDIANQAQPAEHATFAILDGGDDRFADERPAIVCG